MEIVIQNDNPEQGISNYSALIAWAKERTSTYEGLIVQEGSIPSAKADVASLRKLAKDASDYRIQIKKDHEAKIADTINQLKELTDIFSSAAEKIAVQIRAFDEKEKDAKRDAIIEYWDEHVGDLNNLVSISHEKIWNDKWLNKGTSMDSIKETIDKILSEIHESIYTIRGMQVQHESEMISEYLQTLDLKTAIQRRKMLEEQEARIAEMKAKQEAARQQIASDYAKKAPVEPAQKPVTAPIADKIEQIDIRIWVNAEQKAKFREFLRSSGIKYGSVPKNN